MNHTAVFSKSQIRSGESNDEERNQEESRGKESRSEEKEVVIHSGPKRVTPEKGVVCKAGPRFYGAFFIEAQAPADIPASLGSGFPSAVRGVARKYLFRLSAGFSTRCQDTTATARIIGYVTSIPTGHCMRG